VYQRILVALENSTTDEALLVEIRMLAKLTNAELLLVHVADGWVARNFERLKLAESEEMQRDREYLEATADRLRDEKYQVTSRLALGDPPHEILRVAEEEHCDLIAMTTHGHRLLGDLIHGSTITHVRHRAAVPILLVRAGNRKA